MKAKRKMSVIIIHGTKGYPDRNWFPWLKKELEKLGYKVFIPKFPTPENQNLENWLVVLEGYREYIDENTILVGHSIGAAFILDVLERLDHPVRAAFLVAGFIGVLGHPGYDELNDTFANKRFDWGKITRNCKRFYVFNSDNDRYITLEKGNELAKNLGTELIVVKGAGHINQESGYTKFDLILEAIKKEEGIS